MKNNKSVKSCYPNGLCPDCDDPIPKNAKEGDECENCGHVFCHYHKNDG